MIRLGLALVLVSSVAAAQPTFTLGVGGGITQSEAEAQQDPDSELLLFGRISGHRLGFELSIAKLDTTDGAGAKTFTGLAVLDLGHSARWVPQLFAGAGVDRGTNGYEGSHVELGAGLELRLDGGFVLGARFHLGDRWTDTSSQVIYDDCGDFAPCYPVYSNDSLREGQYRSLDAYAGIRF